jgi:hypothetical protein
MEELLRLTHLPAPAAWPMTLLMLALVFVHLLHQVIALLERWDRYRLNRIKARPPRSN